MNDNAELSKVGISNAGIPHPCHGALHTVDHQADN